MLAGFIFAIAGRWRRVHELLEPRMADLARSLPGSWHQPIARVLSGISCAEEARRLRRAAEHRRARGQRRRAQKHLRQLRQWCAAGGNFVHCAELLAGELAALDGDLRGASHHFAAARSAAIGQRNPIYAALASERLALALLADGQERLAVGPLDDARHHYGSWGALAKVEVIELQYGSLLGLEDDHGRDRGSANSSISSRSSSSSSSSRSQDAIDTASLIKASQTLAGDIRLAEVAASVLDIAIENAGGNRGALIMAYDAEDLRLIAETSVDRGTTLRLDDPPPLAELGASLPVSLLHWVARTREDLLLDSSDDRRFAADPYLAQSDAGFSLLCLPIIRRGHLIGLLYLENRLADAAFTEERIGLLRLLIGQVASALENARLYDELRTNEVRWRSLVNQLPDTVIIADAPDRLHFATGEPGAETLGNDENGLELADAIARVFAGQDFERIELQLALAGLERRWYALRMAPIVIDGVVERVIVVCTDIEERKQAETARARLEGQLRQQQRLESIGTLASGVAHEINNP
ncbi:MAG: GAF domain-containing protein, partial [Myxococcales bacterium]|nr:GAF domain-containing protein [Myxococcales bacterium]